MALKNNRVGNYWTGSGAYDSIFYYIQNDLAEVRDDLALMVAGERIPARIQEYAATAYCLESRDQIYSAMVVYGLLTYEDGKVFIPMTICLWTAKSICPFPRKAIPSEYAC